jgi:uncharacterized membrane protein
VWSNGSLKDGRSRFSCPLLRVVVVPSPAASLLAVVFQTASAAEEALGKSGALKAEKDVSVRDAAVVIRTTSGRIELEQTREVAPGEAVVGAGTAGLVAGLLFGLPVAGALVGLAGGAVFGLRDTGIPDSRLRKLGDELQPGQAVLCVLVDAADVARTRAALGRYGDVFEVALSSGSDS